jgi:hypothetical protein
MSKKNENIEHLIPEQPENNQEQHVSDNSEAPQQFSQPLKPEVMDIHAHHLHKAPGEKAWHYFFEFLMLFLAVFCGFLAEYRLEHRIERDKEKEFIAAAIREMKSDLLYIEYFEVDSNRCKNLDTLAVLLLSKDRSQQTIIKMYRFFMYYQEPAGRVNFKRSTLTQLNNAGNMRLIRNSAVVDSLSGWDGSISNSIEVLNLFNKQFYDNQRLGYKVFDARYFIDSDKWPGVEEQYPEKNEICLLNNDERLLHELGAYINVQAITLLYYHRCIYLHKLYTTRLIDFFEKEYDL